MEAVDTGNGIRPEQLRPEQGTCLAGAVRSDGEWVEPSCGDVRVPETISSSIWWRLENESDHEPTEWLQPAQAERGAPNPWTKRNSKPPAHNRASRFT